MHSLMNNPNSHHLVERLNLKFRCAVFDKSDEHEILNHWHFKFPHLRSLSLHRVDTSIINILCHRIVENCPKLESIGFNENYYDRARMSDFRNQFKKYNE